MMKDHRGDTFSSRTVLITATAVQEHPAAYVGVLFSVVFTFGAILSDLAELVLGWPDSRGIRYSTTVGITAFLAARHLRELRRRGGDTQG